jgi:hypothetical protein
MHYLPSPDSHLHPFTGCFAKVTVTFRLRLPVDWRFPSLCSAWVSDSAEFWRQQPRHGTATLRHALSGSQDKPDQEGQSRWDKDDLCQGHL